MLKLTPSPQLILCFLVLLPLHWVQETMDEMTDSKGRNQYLLYFFSKEVTTFSPSTLQHLSIVSWERGRAPQITIKINLLFQSPCLLTFTYFTCLPPPTYACLCDKQGNTTLTSNFFLILTRTLISTTDALLLIYSDLQFQRLPFAIPVNSFFVIATWQITSDKYDLRESHTEVRVSVFVHSKTTQHTNAKQK